MRRAPVTLLALAVAAAVVAGGLALLRDEPDLAVTATFTDSTGLYVGNDVEMLGVPIGTVRRIDPHGRAVAVTMTFPAGTRIPAHAGAVILQGSLVTDRYVELAPAYRSGPTMADGARIPVRRTRSPANVDDIMSAIDDLVVALDGSTSDGKDVGDLVHVAARQLGGRGQQIRDALLAGRRAMRTVSAKDADLSAITHDLDALVVALAARDRTIRRFHRNVAASTTLLAEQRVELHATLRALLRLSRTVSGFVRENRTLVGSDLDRAARTLEVVARNRKGLAETMDLMPLVAENIWRAYDPETHRLRVRYDTRETGPMSSTARISWCHDLGLPDCSLLFNRRGTGALDPLLDLPQTLVPRNF